MAKPKISTFHAIATEQGEPASSFVPDQVKAAFEAGIEATKDAAAKSAFLKDHPVRPFPLTLHQSLTKFLV